LQVAGDEVYVAENSRHRVVRYDSEGKKLTAFGKRDREGLGEGFGGCCNPMNLCFTSEGNLLVSESNGIVKRFTPDGKYLDMVGTAGVPEGCKNSAVGVSSNGDYVFYINVRNSQIVVLERQPAEAAAAP
jgi:sugar lactone lactonase YvrE